jgi:hypothetical protein
MGTHTVGEQFVSLNSNSIVPVGINLTDIGNNIYFEPYLASLQGTTPGSAITSTPECARVRPFAPWNFTATHGSATSASDITLQWWRRARIYNDWTGGLDVPLDESSEVYTVSIYDGSNTLKRQVTVTGPFNATNVSPAGYQGNPVLQYTAAQITADGFTTGQTINFSVYQHSDQGVSGLTATTSITR